MNPNEKKKEKKKKISLQNCHQFHQEEVQSSSPEMQIPEARAGGGFDKRLDSSYKSFLEGKEGGFRTS